MPQEGPRKGKKTKKKKKKKELPYDPTIPLLGIYPDKTIIQKDTCTPRFIAALFTIAKTWKQPKCQLTDEWIKMRYVHTTDYPSAIKKNKIMPSVATWMQPEIILSQKEDKYYIVSLNVLNLKYGTNQPIYKTETDSQTWRTDLWLPRVVGSEMNWEFEVSRCKLLHLESISNEVLLCSTGNYIQSPVTENST